MYFEKSCRIGGRHLNFSTSPLEWSAVMGRADKSKDNVTFRNEPKHFNGWRVNQTTSIILLLRLLSLGEGCWGESERSVVSVNVLAVQRMNKRKNVSDFDRIQIVVARLVVSVDLVGSFTSSAVNTYQKLVRGRTSSNWCLVEVHARPAAAWEHTHILYIGLSSCIVPSLKRYVICLRSEKGLRLNESPKHQPEIVCNEMVGTLHMDLLGIIYYYNHSFIYLFILFFAIFSLLNIMQYHRSSCFS